MKDIKITKMQLHILSKNCFKIRAIIENLE